MDYRFSLGKLEGMLVSTNAKSFVLHSLVREFLISFDDSIKLEEFFESALEQDERVEVIMKIITAFNFGINAKTVNCALLSKIYNKITGKTALFDNSSVDLLLKQQDKVKAIYDVYNYFFSLENVVICEQFARLCVVLLLVKFNILSLPIIDFSFANRKYGSIKNYEDFLLVLKLASESTFTLLQTARKVIKQDKKLIDEIHVKSVYAIYDYALNNLVIDIGGTAKQLDYTFVTVNKALRHLISSKILIKQSGNMRYRTYIYKNLIDVFEI